MDYDTIAETLSTAGFAVTTRNQPIDTNGGAVLIEYVGNDLSRPGPYPGLKMWQLIFYGSDYRNKAVEKGLEHIVDLALDALRCYNVISIVRTEPSQPADLDRNAPNVNIVIHATLTITIKEAP